MIRPWTALLVGVLALSIAPSAARACSCMPPPPPAEALDAASAVFEGRATGVVKEGHKQRFSFDVLRVWKGDVDALAEITTASDSAACGRGYATGEIYVIYAYRGPDGALADGLCTRTRERSRAIEDLAALGPGREPGPPKRGGDPEDAHEPPRIEASADSAPPPSEPGRRGCAVENAHTLGARGLALLLGVGIAIRRRRIVRSRSRSAHRSHPESRDA
jgi:hypothetical protein